MKKFLVCFVVIMVCFSTSIFAKSFSDVTNSFWGYPAIQELSSYGILDGYPDGTFLPNKYVTRAEFAKILSFSLGLESEEVKEFADIEKSHWSKPYINAVSGYMNSYVEDGKAVFKPNTEAVREDVVMAIVLALGMEDYDYNENILRYFSDRDSISLSRKKYIAIAVENELVRGNADGTFNPKGKLTRAQVAQMMKNIFDNSEVRVEPPKNVTSNSSTPTPVPTAEVSKVLVGEITPTATPTQGAVTPTQTATKTPTKTPTKTKTPAPTPTVDRSKYNHEYGDMNGNDVLFEDDDYEALVYAIDYATQGKAVTWLNYDNADMNEDGYIDMLDVAILIDYRNNMIINSQLVEVPYLGAQMIWGDLNFDGNIDQVDYDILKYKLDTNGNYAFTIYMPSGTNKRFRDYNDINQDGIVNQDDLSAIKSKM